MIGDKLQKARADARRAHDTASTMLKRESAPSIPPPNPKVELLQAIAEVRKRNGGQLPGDMGVVLELCENYIKSMT